MSTPAVSVQVSERSSDECIVQLEVNDANAINNEVDAGGHETFDDAVHFVITRGLAEIERTRKAQAKATAQRKALGSLVAMLATNPSAMKELPQELRDAIAAAGLVKK